MSCWIRSALIAITVGTLLGSGPALAASNACKADLNGDLVVNFADLAILKSVFFQRCTDPPPASQALPATGQTTCWDPTDTVVPISTIACPDLIYHDRPPGVYRQLGLGRSTNPAGLRLRDSKRRLGPDRIR